MLEFVIILVMSMLADIGSGLVIRSNWSHVRFKNLPPARLDARSGGDLLLECSVSGSPTPEVAWYKDSMFVSHRDWSLSEDVSSIGVTVARLKINCISESDAGQYECRARSGENEVSAVTQVNIVSNDVPNAQCIMAGRPEIAVWKETLLLEEGDTARLPCRVQEGALDYRIMWTSNEGKPTTDNPEKFTVEQNGDLLIRDITFSEMGQYTCTVSGLGGTQSVHSFVYPLSRQRNSANNR